MAKSGYTQLEKFFGMTSKKFQNENEYGLDYMVYYGQTYDWIEKYADLILNHKGFHDYYKKIIDSVKVAETLNYNENDIVEMLSRNMDPEKMCNIFKDEIKTRFYAGVSKQEGDQNYHKFIFEHVNVKCKNTIRDLFGDMLHDFKQEDIALLIANELKEENAEFMDKQSEMISSICDDISGKAVEYCNKYGQENFEKFMQSCLDCFSNIKVFSSQYSPEQMDAMGQCIFTYLLKSEPDELGTDIILYDLEPMCDIFKQHANAYLLIDYFLDNIEYFTPDSCRFLQIWPSVVYDFINDLGDPDSERNASGAFFDDVFIPFEFSSSKIDDILDVLESNNILVGLKNCDDELLFHAEKFMVFYSFLLDGRSIDEAIDFCNTICQFDHRPDLPLNVYCRYQELGMPDDLLKNMLNHDCELMGYDEIYMAYKNGFSKNEIERCYDVSSVKICQNRLEIQKEKELAQIQGRPSAIQKMKEKENIAKTTKGKHKNQPDKPNDLNKD